VVSGAGPPFSGNHKAEPFAFQFQAGRADHSAAPMTYRKFSIIWILGILLLGGCNSGSPISKLNRANFDQIHEKASKQEVQAILGPPTSTSTEDKLIYKRTTWRYTEGDKYINLTFKNDELDSKDTNLGT
jgi:outer membrane protein assembly factor BamE (lipoprotein component of BamABCDE complex)